MKFKFLLFGLFFCGFSAQASLVSSYDLNGGYHDSLGVSPDLTHSNSSLPNGTLEFSNGSGVELINIIRNGAEYNIEVSFSYSGENSGYGAFMSFNELEDSLLYIRNNELLFYGKPRVYTSSKSFPVDTQMVFGLSRKKSGEFAYYINGEKLKSGYDESNALLLTGQETRISLFIDDGTENLAGSLDYIRIYDNESDMVGDRNMSASDVPTPFVLATFLLLWFARRK